MYVKCTADQFVDSVDLNLACAVVRHCMDSTIPGWTAAFYIVIHICIYPYFLYIFNIVIHIIHIRICSYFFLIVLSYSLSFRGYSCVLAWLR